MFFWFYKLWQLKSSSILCNCCSFPGELALPPLPLASLLYIQQLPTTSPAPEDAAGVLVQEGPPVPHRNTPDHSHHKLSSGSTALTHPKSGLVSPGTCQLRAQSTLSKTSGLNGTIELWGWWDAQRSAKQIKTQHQKSLWEMMRRATSDLC